LPVAAHHRGGDALAPLVVGKSDAGHVGHCRVRADDGFDLGRIDVLAAGNDDVVLAVDQPDEPVFIAVGDVANAHVIAAEGFAVFSGLFQ
jgi:hypothetical protein